jgi:uncharacterized protein YcaQ
MLRPPATPIHISARDARRVWLNAQRLETRAPFGAGAQAVADAVSHLGYVQIDTINVIERCHHHILFTRIPAYLRSDLAQAQSIDKSVFEYWTHALAYVPSADYRFYIETMRAFRRAPGRWFQTVTPKDLRKVMRLIRRDGAITLRDIDDDELREKEHLWASRKPSKRALQFAFLMGQLAVNARDGMLKSFELTDKHFGWNAPPKAASVGEVTAYRLDRALRSQGIVSLDSICHLDAPRKARVAEIIKRRVRKGELVEVALDGAGKQQHWATPQALEGSAEVNGDLVHILSPFDPLIIQRKRTKLFFDYDHLFEAYVPKQKRVRGYFALPVLVGDEIVAALDLKTDRQNRKLLVQQWTWTGPAARRGNRAARKELKRKIEDELGRFERFQLGE